MAWNTKIPHLRRFVLQNFPFIEEDFDALTDYQLICKVVEFLNTVITSQNEVIQQMIDVTADFNQLSDYVDHYFDNLDIQEEINHKLDEMAENGTLEEIVSRYFEHIVITPLQFGAEGDGVTDDTESVQNAIDYAIANGVALHIPDGTYLVSQLTINGRITMYGNGVNSVIKSIDSNNEDCVIYIVNAGINYCSIHDFKIDGNKANQSSAVDGIKLYVNSNTVNPDKYGNLYNLVITNTSGNGITLDSTQSAIREMRLDNITITGTALHGYNFLKVTDTMITRCVAAGTRQCGFYMPFGGSNKFSNCKAFWCGEGDNTTREDPDRVPSNAFTTTGDETPLAGKTYYTRSGTNTINDYYEYALFTGNEFDPDTTYYEMTTIYTKRYQGFYISTTGSVIENCESQENYGDGFYISGSENKMVNTAMDNNGLLTSSGTPVSYASQNKTQLYYGVFVRGWRFNAINCNFTNGLNTSIGKSQRGSAYVKIVGYAKIIGTQDNQVVNTITIQQVGNPLTLSSNLNNEEWVYNIPTATYLLMNTGFELTDTDNNYLYYENGYIHYRLCVKKSDDSGILDGTTAVKLFRFQVGCRPYTGTRLNGIAYCTDDNGYLVNGVVTNFIYSWGDCEVKYVDTSLDSKKQIIVTGSYRVKTS